VVRRATLRFAAGAPLNVLEIAPPTRAQMRELLQRFAPLRPVPLCPELLAHYAHTLIDVWEAAERLARRPLPAPFWAYPWAAGSALARVLLDLPELVAGKRVLDFGAGGGVASLAAARAGAASVIANDIDATALLVCRIAAAAQHLRIDTRHADVCADPAYAAQFDVVLCSDLHYERHETPRQKRVLARARRAGADVIIADAGRTYFDAGGLELLAEYEVPVPADLEGAPLRVARVFRVK
jgi:predicted nicotinamide N-methyase